MGYKYGRHKYGEHLYSRWPDWWDPKTCLQDEWATQACRAGVWADAGAERPLIPPWSGIVPTARRRARTPVFKPVRLP